MLSWTQFLMTIYPTPAATMMVTPINQVNNIRRLSRSSSNCRESTTGGRDTSTTSLASIISPSEQCTVNFTEYVNEITNFLFGIIEVKRGPKTAVLMAAAPEPRVHTMHATTNHNAGSFIE